MVDLALSSPKGKEQKGGVLRLARVLKDLEEVKGRGRCRINVGCTQH